MNRPFHLKNLLMSIKNAEEIYDELLVIDSSTDINLIKLNKNYTIFYGGKYIFFPKKGISKARNEAIIQTKCDIVIFADDDFIVRKGWIKNLISNFQNPEVYCVSGRMISYRNDKISNIFESAMSFDRGKYKKFFSHKNLKMINLFLTISKIGQKRLFDKTPVPWAVGYGFYALKRNIVDLVGFFDENLGRSSKGFGGEDIDMFYRILKKGYKIVYEPTAVIFHNHRKKLNNIYNDAFIAGRTINSFISKYIPRDIYLLIIFFSYFLYSFFSGLNAIIKSQQHQKQMIKMELIGYLK